MANKKEQLDIVLKAKDQYSKEVSRMENKFKVSAKSMAVMGTAIAGTVVALGAVVAKTAETGDMFQKMALRTGFSVKSLSQLAHAAELSGTSIQSMEGSFRKLTKNMADAQMGLATQKRAFDQVGVSVENADGTLRDIETVFDEVIDKLSKMENKTKQAALAQELFGKSGANMLPFIKAGTAAINEMKESASNVFTQEQADQAAEFQDNLAGIKDQATGAASAIGNSLIPSLNNLFAVIAGKQAIFTTLGRSGAGLGTGEADPTAKFRERPEELFGRSVRNAATGDGPSGERGGGDVLGTLAFLEEKQQAERDLIAENNAISLEMRNEFNQSLIDSDLMVQDMRFKAEEKALADAKKFAKLRQDAIISSAGNISSALDSINQMNQGRNQSVFEALKIARIAEATINTYAGANQALAAYPPPYNFIAAGAVVVAGLANVANIQSQSFGGGGGGGGGGTVPTALPPPTDTDTGATLPTGDQGGGAGAQQVSIVINNPLGDENWDDLAEKQILPAIQRAGERDVDVTVSGA